MKKLWKIIFGMVTTICLISLIACLAACNQGGDQPGDESTTSSTTASNTGGGYEPEPHTVEEPDIKLNYSALEMAVGEVQYLAVLDNSETVTWKSSNAQVVSVDASGMILAVSEGKATVTVKVGDKEATCSVMVVSTGLTDKMEIPEIDGEYVRILSGSTFKLNPVMTLRGEIVDYYTFSFAVASGSGIITVDQSGKIIALKAGTATVNVSATHNVTGNLTETKSIQVVVV